MNKPKLKKIIKKKQSKYWIKTNPDGRVNKLTVESSEFPHELWLAKNMKEANSTIELTEKILANRRKKLRFKK